MFDLAATIGKITAVLMVFIIFYLLLHLGGDIGLAIVLSLLAVNIVELKVILTKIGVNK